jgi:endoglucanase
MLDKGMNIFRIPFLMERLAQGMMTATLDATYLAALTTTVNFVTDAGAYAIIDPHNFGRVRTILLISHLHSRAKLR